MQRHEILFITLLVLSMTSNLRAVEPAKLLDQIVWTFDSLERVGSHRVTLVGAPRLVEDNHVKGIEFNGASDGLFLEVNPLAEAEQFTVELTFRPYKNGQREQRFFHMQENGNENRVMFETRLVGKDEWFLDTFIKTGEQERTLYAEEFRHAIGPWYHAALVVDGKQMRHYVSGKLELTAELDYHPQQAGRTSVGVRINKVYWYYGAIREARFTHRALEPDEFTIFNQQ